VSGAGPPQRRPRGGHRRHHPPAAGAGSGSASRRPSPRWPSAAALTIIPGNHDRLGDDVGSEMMPGQRVCIESHPACTWSGSTPPGRTTSRSSTATAR
jgi:hypothetical protein